MNRYKINFVMFVVFLALVNVAMATISEEHQTQYLPENFQLYIHDGRPSVQSKPGDERVYLPTNNYYKINPGCYLACYNHDRGVYAVNGAYVVGQIRIPGQYHGVYCDAKNYISMVTMSTDRLNKLCNQLFAQCNNSCWSGTNTGGWFH